MWAKSETSSGSVSPRRFADVTGVGQSVHLRWDWSRGVIPSLGPHVASLAPLQAHVPPHLTDPTPLSEVFPNSSSSHSSVAPLLCPFPMRAIEPSPAPPPPSPFVPIPPDPNGPPINPSISPLLSPAPLSTPSLPVSYPFLSSPTLLHRRFSSRSLNPASGHSGGGRWSPLPSEGQNTSPMSHLSRRTLRESSGGDLVEDSEGEDGDPPSPLTSAARRVGEELEFPHPTEGRGKSSQKRERPSLQRRSTSLLSTALPHHLTASSSSASAPTSIATSPIPPSRALPSASTAQASGALSPLPSSNPSPLSSTLFGSSSSPSSLRLSWINTLLVFDRSCLLLCALNCVVYCVGVVALLLFASFHSSPQYPFTFQSGFWNGVHVWCCLAATFLLFVLFSQPRSKKQRISAISLCILLVCVVTYVIFATRTLPVYTDIFGHELYPLRYLEWICTTPLMLLLSCNLAVQPVSLVVWVAVMDIAMLVFGLLASASTSYPEMLLWLALSFGAEMDTLFHMHRIFSDYRQMVSHHPRISRTIHFLEVWLYLTYAWFPLIWCIAAVGWLDDAQTSHAYFIGDTCGKLLYTSALLIINFEIIEQEEQLHRVQFDADMKVRFLNERMKSEEESKKHALLSNERKREFLRYFLHEIRVSEHPHSTAQPFRTPRSDSKLALALTAFTPVCCCAYVQSLECACVGVGESEDEL